MPTAANTGPRQSSLSTVTTDPVVLTTNGQTISRVHYTGSVYVNADNVTFNDCTIDGALYPSNDGAAVNKVGLYANYCDIAGIYSYGYDTIEFVRCRFGGHTDDFIDLNRGDNGATHAYFDYCLWDRLQASTGDKHLDALQILGADDTKVRHCVLDYTAPDQATRDQMTGVITMETAHMGHVIDGWEISDCEIYGGGYSQIGINGTNGYLLRNKFHSLADAGNGFTYPTDPMFGPGNAPYTQSGNTLDGAPYTGPT
jgi:hypothetical protein